MELPVKIINGQIIPHDMMMFNTMLHGLEGDFNLSFKKVKKRRSNQQNKYYWGVVIPIVTQGLMSLHGDYLSPEDVHEFLKFRFNYKEIDTGVEVLTIGKQTSSLSTFEFAEYIDKIIIFADEYLNIIIPEPNETYL